MSRQEGAAHVDWVDVASAALLALATVATAWSGYQASRWNGEQAKAGARANAARIESARAAGLANAQKQVDVATFIAWADAYAHGDARLTGFYSDRFRKEFKPAVEAWIATKPLKNRNAPLTPFVMPQYRLAEQTKADILEQESERFAAGARGVHPALHELRARRRSLRDRALLRRHEREAPVAPDPDHAPRPRSRGLHRRGRLDRVLAGQRLRLTS